MVTANKLQPCQQYPAWNSPNSDHVFALLQAGQQVDLPSFRNSSIFTASAVSPRILASLRGWPNLETAQPSGTDGVFSAMLPCLNIVSSSTNQCPSESRFAILRPAGRQVMPVNAPAASYTKKFLVFDQSGDQTRLFIGPSFCPLNEVRSIGDNGSERENLATLVGQSSPMKPIIEEELNRIHSSCEMHEDSKEINALLYSDSDDEEEHDDDGEDDEVTSTDHSPFMVRRGGLNDHELTEEVASSDVSSKRRRLCDGQYKKSSFPETTKPVERPRSCSDEEDDVESSCVKGTSNKGQEKNSNVCCREKKIKIWQTLRILQSVIMDINTKDPLLVIDEAINYLKFLKLKVKEMGIELPQEHISFPP